ncbi:type II secretion system protein GspM [Aureimonas pseudogalii]|uniref:General secretion pathway protein GspM n=1 Tax=Aureimonas pseudogalii TaxID=1744844 RepID=A0A7W6E963_9HYPH|nr:type II secretion system protein GspM [Aureimonas pseudogalii]MBB3997045.1 hypothetical protein [Aureimonas pseudogalii]
MIARLQNAPLARRAGALALLALAAWIVVPPLLNPLQGWRDGRIAVGEESERLDRAQRLAARRAAVVALADTPDAPFLVAPDAASATAGLAARVSGAVAGATMRLTAEASPVIDERPGARVALRYRFEGTQGGLYAFLSAIETRPPFLRVDDLQAVPATAGDGSIGLSGSFAVSTVPLLRPQP